MEFCALQMSAPELTKSQSETVKNNEMRELAGSQDLALIKKAQTGMEPFSFSVCLKPSDSLLPFQLYGSSQHGLIPATKQKFILGLVSSGFQHHGHGM